MAMAHLDAHVAVFRSSCTLPLRTTSLTAAAARIQWIGSTLQRSLRRIPRNCTNTMSRLKLGVPRVSLAPSLLNPEVAAVITASSSNLRLRLRLVRLCLRLPLLL